MAIHYARKRERLRKQYTFTKSKAFIGFVLSVMMSIGLSSYFEKYGRHIYRQFIDMLF